MLDTLPATSQETLILCGGSKGGANALAAAIQWCGGRGNLILLLEGSQGPVSYAEIPCDLNILIPSP